MAEKTIPQRELRNNVAEVLREAAMGTEFTITVRGRPVARLGPMAERDQRRVDVAGAALRAKLTETPVDRDFKGDIAHLRELETPVREP